MFKASAFENILPRPSARPTRKCDELFPGGVQFPSDVYYALGPPGASASCGSLLTASFDELSSKTGDMEAPVPDGCHMTHVKANLGDTSPKAEVQGYSDYKIPLY